MTYKLICGNGLASLAQMQSGIIQCCVTSPPYFGLRDYGVAGQIGLEETPDEYVQNLVGVFREVHRVLADDGVLWLNLGDSYANDGKWGGHTGGKHAQALHASPIGRNKRYTGLKPKDLIGIPWMVAFALRADGWWLRQDIIWSKPNPMPESVQDRCTKAHEHVFLLSKSQRYFFDSDAVKEPCVFDGGGAEGDDEPKSFKGSKFNKGKTAINQLLRSSNSPRIHKNLPGRSDGGKACNKPGQEFRNRRSVWRIATTPSIEKHYAMMPLALAEPCVLAGSAVGDTVLDPFCGTGTTGIVALRHRRHFVGCDIDPKSLEISRRRLYMDAPLLNSEAPATLAERAS